MDQGQREASKLGQFSWALFDWANQPFFTIVTTFIFAPYFANVMVADPVQGLAADNSRPLFGLDPQTHELERLIGPASALWLALFVIPMFLFTPDTAKQRISLLQAARQGGWSLVDTVMRLGRFKNALLYLIAFMLYNDGLAAIIAFGGVYAAATFGWSTVTLGIFGIVLTVFAIPGAFLGGKLDDLIGSKRTVQIAIAGVIVAAIGIVGVSADRVLFFVPAGELSSTR